MTPVSFDSRAIRVLNGAASQIDRLKGAPHPDRIKPDGRSLAQLLAFGARYGVLVRFYDLSDRPNGDWEAFFASDPSVALAVLGALDLPEIEAALRVVLALARRSRDMTERERHRRHAVRVILRLTLILDARTPIAQDAEPALAALAATRHHDDLTAPLQAWGHHWQHRPGQPGPDWHLHALELLEDIASTLIPRLQHAANEALSALDVSLSTQGHAPQAALWNAFVMLFDEARYELNRFPHRLLDFYDTQVLRQDHRDPRPSSVFLTFTLAQSATEAAIAKGSLFLAGNDAAGDPIYYAADTALEVRPATVTSFGVYRVQFAFDGDQAPKSGVLSGTLPAPLDSGSSLSFPLFGASRPGQHGDLLMAPATLGFVVESATLLLQGGDRALQTRLALGVIPDWLLSAALAGILAEADRRDPETPLSIPLPALELLYSTAGGWMKVEAPTIMLRIEGPLHRGEILASFSLPQSAPPLEPVSSKADPDAPAADLPASTYPDLVDQPTLIARLIQESDATSGIYALLSILPIRAVEIGVEVEGLVPTRVSGSSGAIDPEQNFAVFGLTPAQYSALEFSATELFVKRVHGLETRIDWAALPVTTTGFRGYYKGYRLNADGIPAQSPLFDNTSFRVAFDIVAPGSWTLDTAQTLYLFQTHVEEAGTESVPPQPDAPVAQQSLLRAQGIEPQEPPPYYNPSDGALRLLLVEPDYAFGNILYASNLMAASQANAAAAQTRAAGAASVRARIAQASAVNTSATAQAYADDMGQAVENTISALNAQAYAALQTALSEQADGDADAAAQSLQAAISQVGGGAWRRLFGGRRRSRAASVTAALRGWMADHAGSVGEALGAIWPEVETTLSAADTLANAWRSAAGTSVAATRPLLAAALERIQARLATALPDPLPVLPDLPNQPWLPSAAAFSLNYRAHTAFDVAGTALAGLDRFLHLAPFGDVKRAIAPPPGEEPQVPLLPEVQGSAAFYVELSTPVTDISLLFVLSAGPNGDWTEETATPRWEKKRGDQWLPITVRSDTTNGLNNSGIVVLQVATFEDAEGAQTLRAVLPEDAQNGAYVVSVTANALNATWTGPGGAATLGEPLPAGTIQQSKDIIAGLGTITQPMQSVGGAPPLRGAAFHLWMAERLRHKGFAIDAWDYARLVLAAIPTLWQLAVVPATNGSTRHAAPGHVWIVPVAGPQTANITDTTTPTVDPSVLSEIGEVLAAVASPFATVTVTNPPYLRLTVRATLVFSDSDTTTFWIETLQAELVQWLSPWPVPALGHRPEKYYTRQEIAEFVRSRSYVEAIVHLEVLADRVPDDGGWHYLTSALEHQLFAYTPPVADAATAGDAGATPPATVQA
ncbi:hypothetical protein [Sphingomonas pokkalii]|uniref:Baseplate protein J-like domain-containing protein n=1 Tax=Sphingomonas pokkalii TaxID=2175090 RepID=A0A2U0SFD1_9SPHN|nr:hypothetical protein [Sphingomonas pokkalii]PVX30082.1 hypothetical protein DD559_12695 [Sphingomonas pokkalii]